MKVRLRGNRVLRALDALFGRILILMFKLVKRRRLFPSQIKSIALLKLSGIGDLILLSGIIKDIHQKHPSSKILLFCGSDNAVVAPLLSDVDKVITLPIENPFSAMRILRTYSPSLLLDFGQWSRIESLIAYFSKSQYLVGFKTAGQQRHYLYDKICVHNDKVHEIENFRSLAEKVGIQSMTPPTLSLKEEPLSTKLEEIANEKCIVFHPWPSGLKSHLKEWPLEYWHQLGNILIANGYYILVSGSQANFKASQSLIERLNNPSYTCNIAGELSFSQLGYLFEKSKCVITVNTGVMHFASCLKTFLIALNGPTSIKRWGPLNPEAIALQPDCPNCGYLNLGFEYPKNPPPCMENISLQKVLEALAMKQLIKRT